MIQRILKLEGLAVFLGCLYLYNERGASWLLFVLLWLAPDISMLGYLKGSRFGAVAYNVAHTYVLALLVVGVGFLMGNNLIVSFGIILASHVGLDRFLGFGLKYPSGFKDTHLQKL